MNLIFPTAKVAIQFVMFFLLAQLMPGDVPQDTRDPFTRETTPPLEFQLFNEDFSSLNLDSVLDWLNEDLGLVKDGVLLTYDEAVEAFEDEYAGVRSGDVKGMHLVYNYGGPAGDNHWQADCWVEWLMDVNGEDTWLRFHHMFVFKILDQHWYLVQSEFIPSEASVNYESESNPNAPDWSQFSRNNIYDTSLGALGTWPLLLGTNYADESQLQQIEGTMFNGKKWSLKASIVAGKPTILYFISIQNLMVETDEVFNGQMDFLANLYDEIGFEDAYIFCVSDELRERFEMLAADGHDNYVPLLDEDSTLHTELYITHHPYVVVFDAQGTVVALSKTWHESSNDLMMAKIKAVVEANKAG